MLKKSPPKHRHDGVSPLPLGMDWSPPPKKWDGRDTVWPHDPHMGWSYCVTIPSWTVLPETKTSDGSLTNPIVFYRVQVGIQSPEGVTTTRGILRRFSDFLKLFATLKRVFPKKNLPPAPPKHAFVRISSSRVYLDERRYALEEWINILLSDIDLSRSVPVASFLELEAAARSSFHDTNQAQSSLESNPSTDNAYETVDLGVPSHGTHQISETGTEDAIYEDMVHGGLSSVNSDLSEQLEGFPRNKVALGRDRIQNAIDFGDEREDDRIGGHARKLSIESTASDLSSVRGSELSNIGLSNLLGDGSIKFPGGSDVTTISEASGSADLQFLSDIEVVLPSDQRLKIKRVLTTMQRRLTTAKTDMEDLIARLNQEIAVKEYLTTKVKDLDVELETTKQKSKENLQQAILLERERITQMQWDMEELRRKSLEMETKFKDEQDEKILAESAKKSAISEKELLFHELDITKEQLANLQKQHEELEIKAKADFKVLVKEVKSLRKSQSEFKQELNQKLKEKAELERMLQKEKQRRENAKAARVKLLHECGILRQRLQECSVNFLVEEEDKFTVDSSSLSDALDLLTTSDNRIGLLLAEAQLLAQEDDSSVGAVDKTQNSGYRGNLLINGDDQRITDDDDGEIRKMLTDIFIDNARLRKLVNSVIRSSLNTVVKSENDDGDEAPSRKTVLSKFLER